jgi:DNA-binding beta-propeller fold protein YncE
MARDLSGRFGRTRSVDRRRFLAAAASGSLVLAFDPRAFAARVGGSGVAFVTADLESHVVLVELASGTTLDRIRTAPGPRSIEAVHGRTAVVAHTEHSLVTLIDAVPRRIRAELDGFEAPRYTAVHPSTDLVYITDSAAEEVVTVDAVRGRVLARTRVPGPARHIGVSIDGRTLWTSLGSAATGIAVLDNGNPRRPRFERTVSPPFLAHDVVFAPDGRTVWVTSGSERRVALYRSEGRPSRVLASGTAPQHVTFARQKVFVACGDDGVVHRHRLAGERVREARVPVGSYNVTFGWGRVVTPSLGDGTVSLLDRNGHVRAVRKVALAAHDACILVT